MKKNLKHAGTGLLVTLVLFLLVEGLLRLFAGAPSGKFDFLLGTKTGLYPPNAEIVNSWGTFTYTVHTNSLGLRGPEATREKPAGKKRILALGDSMTDGFFVDNDATLPYILQNLLEDSLPSQYEVLNLARGGGSIDKEYTLLNSIGLPLQPDLVLLTFVTNDISDLRGKPRETLLSQPTGFDQSTLSWRRKAFNTFITQTAIGEVGYHLVFESSVPRTHDLRDRTGDDRYDIPGGADFRSHVTLFEEQTQQADGIILGETFSPETDSLIDNYLFVLDAFQAQCEAAGVDLIFVYMPAYPQVFDPGASFKIRDHLAEETSVRGIPFCDLTLALKAAGSQEVIHLVPADFHLNPRGNHAAASGLLPCVLNSQ